LLAEHRDPCTFETRMRKEKRAINAIGQNQAKQAYKSQTRLHSLLREDKVPRRIA
jgi:hypothetical protein